MKHVCTFCCCRAAVLTLFGKVTILSLSGSRSKKKRTSPAGRPKKGPDMDARLLAFVAKDLGL